MQTSKLASLLLTSMLWGSFSVSLLAHASVNPRTAPAGVHHMLFYVRAPVEQAIPVIELGFEVDEEWRNNGGDVNSFQDMPAGPSMSNLTMKGKSRGSFGPMEKLRERPFR